MVSFVYVVKYPQHFDTVLVLKYHRLVNSKCKQFCCVSRCRYLKWKYCVVQCTWHALHCLISVHALWSILFVIVFTICTSNTSVCYFIFRRRQLECDIAIRRYFCRQSLRQLCFRQAVKGLHQASHPAQIRQRADDCASFSWHSDVLQQRS